MPNMRTESDSMGKIKVAADRYWGAQTQRLLRNFTIGGDRFTWPAMRALGLVKKAVALANLELKMSPPTSARSSCAPRTR